MKKNTLDKILIIDDDEDILFITKCCLKTLPNIVVMCASSGAAGISESINFHPDLILLDVMMPKMDGIDTLKGLRQIPSLEKTPVVFFTAKIQYDEIQSYLNYGIVDVITKPFDPINLPIRVLDIWNTYIAAQKKRSLHG